MRVLTVYWFVSDVQMETFKMSEITDGARAKELIARFDLLTEEDLSSLAGVKLITLRDWRVQGRGPIQIKVGNRVLFRADDVAAWLKTQRVTS
jgi:hypothetical protein